MKRLRQNFLPVFVFAKVAFKRSFRDKFALFFTFAFPVIFLLIFGSLLGNNVKLTFRIGIINQSSSGVAREFIQDANKFKLYKVDQSVDTLDKTNEKMIRGEIDATVVLPPEFGTMTPDGKSKGQAYVNYTENNAYAASALRSVLQSKFENINLKVTGIEMPYEAVTVKKGPKGLSKFDYTFAGLLGFSIIGLGIFGPVMLFPNQKKQGVLRRLRATPLRTWQYFSANMLAQTVIGLATITTQFLVAMALFGLKMRGSYGVLVIFLILSIIMIYGIGLALGGWASNEQQAAPLGNIIVFPMLFLSGTFFPRFSMPEWLQHVSSYLPLTPVIDGTRLIMTEHKNLFDVAPQVGLIAVWIVVIYAIAFRVFRWE